VILETMSVKEAAEQLGVHLDSIYQAAHSESGRLRAVRCGKQLRVLAEDVRNYQPRAYPRKNKAGSD
jgi:excisionase family DNA binding protein